MDWSVIIVIINLIILESLLSVDNAAVLAIMVSKLPVNQRNKALRYGILGAYIFRGLCLFIASYLVRFGFLKVLGGAYLLYLSIKGLKGGEDSGSSVDTNSKWFNSLWGTVVMVEVMDIIFSIDNIFAAVALSDKIIIIWIGVGIGILAMRFVAGYFVKLIEKYPSLSRSAYIVILLLGIKLIIDGVLHYISYTHIVVDIIESHVFDLVFSTIMMIIFFVPLLYKKKEDTIVL